MLIGRILNCFPSKPLSTTSSFGGEGGGLLKRVAQKVGIVKRDARETRDSSWEEDGHGDEKRSDGALSSTFRRSNGGRPSSNYGDRRDRGGYNRPRYSGNSDGARFQSRPRYNSENGEEAAPSRGYQSERRDYGEGNEKPTWQSMDRPPRRDSNGGGSYYKKPMYNSSSEGGEQRAYQKPRFNDSYEKRASEGGSDVSKPRPYWNNNNTNGGGSMRPSYDKPRSSWNNDKPRTSWNPDSPRPSYQQRNNNTERYNSRGNYNERSNDRYGSNRKREQFGEGEEKGYRSEGRGYRGERPNWKSNNNEAAMIRTDADNVTVALRLKGISIRHGTAQVMSSFSDYLTARKRQSGLTEDETPNLILFNSAIDLLSQGGHLQDCMLLTARMRQEWGIEPNDMTVCSLLSALGEQMIKKEPPKDHAQLFQMIKDKYWKDRPIEDSVFVYNAILKYYGRSDVNRMLEVFPPAMPNQEKRVGDLFTYTTCIESLGRSNRPELALEYHRNRPSELTPDATYYKALVYSFVSIVHTKSADNELKAEMMDIIKEASNFCEYQLKSRAVHALILTCLRKLNEHDMAIAHFKECILPLLSKVNLDEQVVTLHLRSLVYRGLAEECFERVEYLKQQLGYQPDAKAITALMEAAASLRSATKAEELLKGYIKTGKIIKFSARLPYWYVQAVEGSGLGEEEIELRVKKLKAWCQSAHPASYQELEELLAQPQPNFN